MDVIQQAIGLLRGGRFAEAEAVCRAALRAHPDRFELNFLLGNIHLQQSKPAEAVTALERAIQIDPASKEAMNLLAGAYYALNRRGDALAQFDRLVALTPNDIQAEFNRGVLLTELGRLDEALGSYDRVLARQPALEDALYNRANVLLMLGRHSEAVASYDRILAKNQRHVGALINRGNALSSMRRTADALACFERVLAINPDELTALNNRGNIYKDLGRWPEAVANYDRALAISPNYVDALYNRGVTSILRGRLDEAKPDLERVLTIAPDYARGLDALTVCKTGLCDWDGLLDLVTRLMPAALEGKIEPFTLLKIGIDPDLLQRCLTNYARRNIPAFRPLWQGERYTHDRIRIAYVSADYRVHPIPYLVAEVFELHDRDKFEIIGISLGPDDKSDIRARIAGSFDQFHDVRSLSDDEAAALIRRLEIDVAVDLNNYTEMSRPGILARRPAPVQASYLGVPVTMGAGFIDYAIADKFVLPRDQQQWWTEKIVEMPDCYLASDMVTKRNMPVEPPARANVGLPERGFVFCCFNNSFKVTPPVFETWMRLLIAVEGSFAWMSPVSDPTRQNLVSCAERAGVDPARLIFAPRLDRMEDHLSRHRAADLFLDTLPYNAHTTAADALWAGLPVVTCAGKAFPARVAGSLLNTIGLPELVTHSLAEYEALALKLARDPALLADIKARLLRSRDSSPLFDTRRFTRHLEQAFASMVERQRSGQPPAPFAVEALV